MKFTISVLRRKPTMEVAVAGMSKALDQLNKVVEHEDAEIKRLNDAITNANADRVEASLRRNRASAVAGRFADLLK